jgi:hypothetical protein
VIDFTAQPLLDTIAPTVESLLRFGIHSQPTTLAIRFSEPLDSPRALIPSIYQIIGPGRRPIRIRSVAYDAATNTVTIRPAQRLNLHARYQLRIVGGALTDLAGNALAGANGAADYTASITRANLVLPQASVKKPTPTVLVGPGITRPGLWGKRRK